MIRVQAYALTNLGDYDYEKEDHIEYNSRDDLYNRLIWYEPKDFFINDTLKRSKLIEMEVDRQMAVFRSCSPDAKADLYRFKIKSDLKKDKTLTKADRKILKQVYRHIKPKIYRNPKDKREIDFRQYVEDKIGNLGWNEEKCYKYLETIMTASEYESRQTRIRNQ